MTDTKIVPALRGVLATARPMPLLELFLYLPVRALEVLPLEYSSVLSSMSVTCADPRFSAFIRPAWLTA